MQAALMGSLGAPQDSLGQPIDRRLAVTGYRVKILHSLNTCRPLVDVNLCHYHWLSFALGVIFSHINFSFALILA